MKGPKHSAKIIKAKNSRSNMFPKWKKLKLLFWLFQINLIWFFSWRVHPPILENWKPSWLAPLCLEDAGSFQSEQLKLHLGLAQPVKSLQLLSQNPWLKVWTLFWAEAIGVLLASAAFEIEVGKGCWSLSLSQSVIGWHRTYQSQLSWEIWPLEIMEYMLYGSYPVVCFLAAV